MRVRACVCNISQCSVVVKYLKVVQWSRVWGLGLGWGPAQSTIWILRSCQTTTHTQTHIRRHTHTHNPVCAPDHPRRQRPAGLEVMSRRCGCTDNTHRSHKKVHVHTCIHCQLKKNCTASYLNHTLTPTRPAHTHTHAHTHTSSPSLIPQLTTQSTREIM